MGKVIRRGAEVRQQVLDILRAGGSLDDAAMATGFCRNYVRQIGAKNGIRFKRGAYGPHDKTKYDRDRIIELHNSGKKVNEITELLSISATTVYKALHSAGIWHQPKKQQNIAYIMRFCPECNTAFLCDPRGNKIFCSYVCSRANEHKRNDATRRARKRSAVISRSLILSTSRSAS